MLAGEADLLFPDEQTPGDVRRHRMMPGKLVYYPAGFAHTIEATGGQPAQYLMLRWNAPERQHVRSMSFSQVDLNETVRPEALRNGFGTVQLLDGYTRCLKRLHAHLSFLAPGGGYEPHADTHDVVLILIDGVVETLEERVQAPAAVFYRAGEPHGILNPSEGQARYLVVEFHGSDIPFRESAPVRVLMRLIRRLLPTSIRRRLRRFLAGKGQGNG